MGIYKLPAIDLLEEVIPASRETGESVELMTIQAAIISTLEQFGMAASPGAITNGPTIMPAELDSWGDIVRRLPGCRNEVTRLCEEFPEARELVLTNPALALCVACSGKWDTLLKANPTRVEWVEWLNGVNGVNGVNERQVIHGQEHLLKSKRRVLCQLLGFPGTEAMVRVLAKIQPEACSIPLLMRARIAFRNEAIAPLLGHLPAISPQILRVCLCWRWGRMVSLPLLEELGGLMEAGMVAPRPMMLLDDTLRLLIRANRPVPTIRSLNQLRNLHDRLAGNLNTEEETESEDWVFPAPPFPGNSWIEPLTTPQLLAGEGKNQHHCAAILAREVAGGRLYVYKITEPERATLSISHCHGGRWRIDQLYASCNRPVSKATFRQVREWLERRES